MKLSIQFHASRDELFCWVASWVNDMNLSVALESFAVPYRVKVADKGGIGEAVQAFGHVNRLSLSLHPIDVDATSAFDFVRRNPDMLLVSPGGGAEGWLRESTISAMTDDPPSLNAWKKIRAKTKQLMNCGEVSVVNPVSGARQKLKSHYYSSDALDLANRGVRMLASAGWNEYELDK